MDSHQPEGASVPRYFWQADDAISHAEVKENLKYRFAHLHPREGMDGEALQAIPHQLQRHGLIATPEIANDGTPMLRVRGFKKASELFNTLQAEGLTGSAPANKEPLEEELNPQVKSARQFIREYSIPLAGATYLIADAMPIASGFVRNTKSEMVQGAMFATTSLGLLLFGRKNPDVQMGNMYTRMKDFLAQEGVELQGDSALALEQLQRDPSYWNGLINFLYEHPVLFNNSIQGGAGVMQFQAGTAQKNAMKQAAGVSVAAGQWGGLLVPEDKYAGLTPEQKAYKLEQKAKGEEEENGFHTRFVDNPVAWVQEKPLRLTAIGPIIGNILTGASAVFVDRQKVNDYFGLGGHSVNVNPNQIMRDIGRGKQELLKMAGVSHADYCADVALGDKGWLRKHTELENIVNTQLGLKFTMMSPVFNIVANTLYGMSSKDERSVNLDKEGYLDELLGLAANVYAQVPEEQRSEKLIRFAGFLRSQPDINISEQVIRERLEHKIAAMEKSDWVSKVANENHEPQAAIGV